MTENLGGGATWAGMGAAQAFQGYDLQLNLNSLFRTSLSKDHLFTFWSRSFPAKGLAETPRWKQA